MASSEQIAADLLDRILEQYRERHGVDLYSDKQNKVRAGKFLHEKLEKLKPQFKAKKLDDVWTDFTRAAKQGPSAGSGVSGIDLTDAYNEAKIKKRGKKWKPGGVGAPPEKRGRREAAIGKLSESKFSETERSITKKLPRVRDKLVPRPGKEEVTESLRQSSRGDMQAQQQRSMGIKLKNAGMTMDDRFLPFLSQYGALQMDQMIKKAQEQGKTHIEFNKDSGYSDLPHGGGEQSRMTRPQYPAPPKPPPGPPTEDPRWHKGGGHKALSPGGVDGLYPSPKDRAKK